MENETKIRVFFIIVLSLLIIGSFTYRFIRVNAEEHCNTNPADSEKCMCTGYTARVTWLDMENTTTKCINLTGEYNDTGNLQLKVDQSVIALMQEQNASFQPRGIDYEKTNNTICFTFGAEYPEIVVENQSLKHDNYYENMIRVAKDKCVEATPK